MIPLLILLGFSGHILYAIGQPYELSFACQTFLRYSSISWFAQMYYDIDRKYLVCIGDTASQSVVPIITLFLHGLWSYIFFIRLDMKLAGAALVQILQYFVNYFCVLFIMLNGRGRQYLQWPNKKSFEGWGTIVWKAIPSYLHEFVARVSFDSFTFIAGFISVELVMVNGSIIR